jgi:hypothetical protein
VFERVKTFYTLDCAATVAGSSAFQITEILGFHDRLVFGKNVTFRKLDLFPPSGVKVGCHLLSWVCSKEVISIKRYILSEYWAIEKSRSSVIHSAIYHNQNPLESDHIQVFVTHSSF